MKVLNISASDYANYSHSIATALRSVGVDCIDVCTKSHDFKYQTSSVKANTAQIISHIQKADVVQVMHSDKDLFNIVRRHNRNAEIVVYHTGTRYRENYLELNKLFAGITTVTDQTELMKLGQHHYVVSPVNVAINPSFIRTSRVNIGHYPSNTEVKGTDDIVRMLSKFKGRFNFRFSAQQVPHSKQMERINRCDVYVELFKPVLWGREYGCFGVTALEAAGLGKLVITQDLNAGIYAEHYGKNPFILANCETKFKSVIEMILDADTKALQMLQKTSHQITQENHSFEATGQRVLSIINSL